MYRPQSKKNPKFEYFDDNIANFATNYFKTVDANVRGETIDLPRDCWGFPPSTERILTFNGLFPAVREDLPWSGKDEIEQGTTQVTITVASAAVTDRRESFVAKTHVNRYGSMANLLKTYLIVEVRYSGSMTDSFDRKFRFFIERFYRTNSSKSGLHYRFSIELTEYAHQLVFDYYSPKNLDFTKPVTATKDRFRATERTLSWFWEWERISLIGFRTANADKIPSLRLELSIKKLSDI